MSINLPSSAEKLYWGVTLTHMVTFSNVVAEIRFLLFWGGLIYDVVWIVYTLREGPSTSYFCICGLDLANYPRMLKCI